MKDLNLTATGMVTPLGMNTESTAAAVRAGLARCFASDVGQVVTSSVRGLTGELRGPARLDALLLGSLKALGEQLEQQGPDRSLAALFGASDSAVVIALPARCEEEMTAGRCSALVDLMKGRTTLPQHTVLVFGSRTAAWRGVAELWPKLVAGEIARVFVWAADSLVESESLEAYGSRVKHLGEPAGFTAGEAGAAVLLEVGEDASPEVGVRVGEPRLVFEEPEPKIDEVQTGLALSRAITAALDGAGLDASWVLSDLNGETWRFEEFGYALCRYDGREGEKVRGADRTVWHPADCLGDLGVATPLVGMALVGRALERGYAPHDHALLMMGEIGAARGAMTMRQTTRSEA